MANNSTNIFQYANEFLSISVGKSFKETVENLPCKPSILFSFNPNKYNAFCKRFQEVYTHCTHGTPVNEKTSIKFLGRIINASIAALSLKFLMTVSLRLTFSI